MIGTENKFSPVMAGLIHIVHTLGVLANSGRLVFYECPSLPNGELIMLPEPEKFETAKILNFEPMKRVA